MKQSVPLTQGCYRGSEEKDESLSFKGIPYAAPLLVISDLKLPNLCPLEGKVWAQIFLGPPAHSFRAVRNMARDGLAAILTRTADTSMFSRLRWAANAGQSCSGFTLAP